MARPVLARHPIPAATHPLRPARRRLRIVVRLALVVAWTVPACALQALLAPLGPRRQVVRLARPYWRGVCRILRLEVRILGQRPADGRPVIHAANHTSWLDVPALGAALPAAFVAKADVAGWPGIGIVARLGRTVFVSRTRAGTGRESDAMRARLAAGGDLILFPEGTSNDGVHVLPFRSAFFGAADAREGGTVPWVQPVSIAYDRIAGLPTLRANRAALAWYGAMALWPSLLAAAALPSFRVTIRLHEPLDPAASASRKALAKLAWETVGQGAARLRQDR